MDRIVILPNGKPSVSTRVSISWPPALPAEDSSVLVLSSCSYKSKSDSSALPFLLYLDLRLSLPLSLSSKITWAFAGIRHTLQLDPHPRFRWDHIIDSRNGMEGSDTVDEGETVVSHNHEVETGIGWNPETNRVERYEELWSEEALTPGQHYAFLTIDEDPQKSYAFIAIVGPHALALSQVDGQPFRAVRMIKSASSTLYGWDVVCCTSSSMNSTTLEATLCDFLALLNEKENTSTLGFWTRGDKVLLGWENGPVDWTVFDCGVIPGS